MAFLLPFAAMGGIAVYANKQTNPGPSVEEHQNTLAKNEASTLHKYGGSSAKNFNNRDRLHMQGAPITDGVGTDNSWASALEDPNFDIVAHLGLNDAADSAADRVSTEWSLQTNQGMVVPRRKNLIVAAFNDELHHPDDTSATTEFYRSKFAPPYANTRQIKDATYMMNNYGESPHERNLRAFNGTQFNDRAQGQSFRYSED